MTGTASVRAAVNLPALRATLEDLAVTVAVAGSGRPGDSAAPHRAAARAARGVAGPVPLTGALVMLVSSTAPGTDPVPGLGEALTAAARTVLVVIDHGPGAAEWTAGEARAAVRVLPPGNLRDALGTVLEHVAGENGTACCLACVSSSR